MSSQLVSIFSRRSPTGVIGAPPPIAQESTRVPITQLTSPRRPGRWLATVVVVVAFGGIIWSIAKNPNLQWSIIGHYLFSDLVLHGVLVTCYLTVMSVAIGFV